MKYKLLVKFDDHHTVLEAGEIIEVLSYDGRLARIDCKVAQGAPMSLEFILNFCEKIK